MLTFNITIDILAFILLMVIVLMNRSGVYELPGKSWFTMMLFIAGILLLTDIASWVVDGRVFPGSVTVSYAINTLFYMLQTVFGWAWLIFADIWNHWSEKGARTKGRFMPYRWP